MPDVDPEDLERFEKACVEVQLFVMDFGIVNVLAMVSGVLHVALTTRADQPAFYAALKGLDIDLTKAVQTFESAMAYARESLPQ